MVENSSNFFVYRASAGSGKTYTLALRYIAQLLKGNPKTEHRTILAVTFTNDAAGEMKQRILEYLRQLSEGVAGDFLDNLKQELPEPLASDDAKIRSRAQTALAAIMHDYSNLHITTIDSFFQKVVRNLAKELGVGSRFEIELNTELPIKEAVHALIDETTQTAHSDIFRKLTEFVEHKLEDDTWSIERDMQTFGKNIFNEAFQKNQEAIKNDFQNNPDKIRQAVAECRKIRKLFENQINTYIDNFYATAPDELDQYFASLKLKTKSSHINTYFGKLSNNYNEMPDTQAIIALSDYFLNESSPRYEFLKVFEYKNRELPRYNSAGLLLKFIHQLILLEDIAEKVNAQSNEQNRFILANTNQLLSGLLGEGDAEFLFEKIGAQIESVVIDEFQDTSALQWRNFGVLIHEMLAGNRFGMIVGDVKQSIYRWRGGDWRILNNIEHHLPGQAKYRTLEANYRSAKNIIEFNNSLFARAAEILQNDESDQKLPFRKAYNDVTQKTVKSTEGYVSVDFVETKYNSYNVGGRNRMLDALATKLKLMIDNGVRQSDICLLCRTNTQVRTIAAKLPTVFEELFPDATEKIAIISENAYLFGSSPALRMLIAALRMLNEPDNNVAAAELAAIIHQYDPQIFDNMATYIEEVRDIVNQANNNTGNLFALIEELSRRFDIADKPEHSPFLFAFTDRLTDYLARNRSDIGRFLDYWDEKMAFETLPVPTGKGDRRDGILALTVHKSKGLEFHTVILPFTDWAMAEKSGYYRQNIIWNESADKEKPFDFALLPLEYNTQMEQSLFTEAFDEETQNLKMDSLNVLYVALTRAGKNLSVLAKKPSSKFMKKEGQASNIQDIIFDSLNLPPDNNHFEIGKIEPSSTLEQNVNDYIKISYNPQTHSLTPFLSTEARLFAAGDDQQQSGKVRRGNIIHRIFENIEPHKPLREAITKSVNLIAATGDINENERDDFTQTICQIFENRGIKVGQNPWIDNSCTVLQERTILTASGREYRPDQVVIDPEGNVTVIDFKTGIADDKHRRQLDNYISLLRRMNIYGEVRGELWYI